MLLDVHVKFRFSQYVIKYLLFSAFHADVNFEVRAISEPNPAWVRCYMPSTGGIRRITGLLKYSTTAVSPATHQLTLIHNAINSGIVSSST